MVNALEHRITAVRYIDSLATAYSGRKRAPRLLPRNWKQLLAEHMGVANRNDVLEHLLPAQFVLRDAAQHDVISRCGEDYLDIVRLLG